MLSFFTIQSVRVEVSLVSHLCLVAERALLRLMNLDYVALNIPTYPDVVRHPMDLGTIRNKLESGAYPVPPYAAFEADMRLVFHNCYIFNPPGTPVNLWGKQSQAVFEEKWSVRPTGEDEEERAFPPLCFSHLFHAILMHLDCCAHRIGR